MIDIFEYMEPYFKLKALHAAFELKLIQRMAKNNGHMTKEMLCRVPEADNNGCLLILRVLILYKIMNVKGEDVFLSAQFLKDYASFGPEMQKTIKYMNLAYQDFESLALSKGKAASKGLISNYWKEQNLKEYCSFLTSFTRMEFKELCKMFDFSKIRYVVDMGGNDGEFITSLCKSYPSIKGGVVDRPSVCRLGRVKANKRGVSKRVEFFPGDFFVNDLPMIADLIVFKSVLNDWDDKDVIRLLQRSYQALPIGGKIIIVEHMKNGDNDDHDRLNEIIFHYLVGPHGYGRFRQCSQYGQFLTKAGFTRIKVQKMKFSRFYFMVAQKTGGIK